MSKGWIWFIFTSGAVFLAVAVITFIWQDGQNDRDRQNLLEDVRELQTHNQLNEPRLSRLETIQSSVTDQLAVFDVKQDDMKDLIHVVDVRLARLEVSQSVMCKVE